MSSGRAFQPLVSIPLVLGKQIPTSWNIFIPVQTDPPSPVCRLASGLFLAFLDTSIVATSLFSIAAEFESLDNINWVALAYTLSYLGCAVLFARVSDVIGRKWAFLSGYVFFIGFSLACGWAKSLNQLIAFRALQGIGGSLADSVTMIIFPEVTPDESKKFISAIIGMVIAVAGVLGPVLGGVFTHYTTWRWVFWLNGPVGGVSALCFLLTWPNDKYIPKIERRRWKDLDYLGSALLVASAVLIVFSFQNAATDSSQWSRAIFLAPLIIGVAALPALFGWQLFIEKKWHGRIAGAVPLDLLRNRVYTYGVLNTLFLGFPYLLSVYVFPIRFQVVNNKSPLEAGVMLLPLLGGSALGSTIGGAVNGKTNRQFESLVAAALLMILGCGLETMSSSDLAVDARTLGFMVFIGLGFGLSATASTMLASFESTVHEHASGQAILSQARIMGGSIGIAASSAILGVKTRSELAGVLTRDQLVDLAHSVATLTPEQHAAVRVAYTDAFREDMIICCAVLAASLFVSLGIYRKNRLSVAEQQRQRYANERARREAAKRHSHSESTA
ncbi:major facilitator superfamily transporter [Thozetella sp. PMI_491]|nr:major facilitator superfamily transporter [Thozetella sp. PMI_491]